MSKGTPQKRATLRDTQAFSWTTSQCLLSEALLAQRVHNRGTVANWVTLLPRLKCVPDSSAITCITLDSTWRKRVAPSTSSWSTWPFHSPTMSSAACSTKRCWGSSSSALSSDEDSSDSAPLPPASCPLSRPFHKHTTPGSMMTSSITLSGADRLSLPQTSSVPPALLTW